MQRRIDLSLPRAVKERAGYIEDDTLVKCHCSVHGVHGDTAWQQISPPFGSRANASRARSMSAESCTGAGVTWTPTAGAQFRWDSRGGPCTVLRSLLTATGGTSSAAASRISNDFSAIACLISPPMSRDETTEAFQVGSSSGGSTARSSSSRSQGLDEADNPGRTGSRADVRSWRKLTCSGVRPCSWTVSGRGSDRLLGVAILVLCRVSDRLMRSGVCGL